MMTYFYLENTIKYDLKNKKTNDINQEAKGYLVD